MKDTDKMRRERSKHLEECRALLDKAEEEGRELTAEEEQEYDRRWNEAEKLEKRIKRKEDLAAEEKRLEELQDGEPPKESPAGPEGGDRSNPRDSEEYRKAFKQYLRSGHIRVPEEIRAIQADLDVSGGYLVTPQQFVNQLIKAVDDAVIVRQLATVHTVDKAESLGAPSLDSDPADPIWTSELGTGDEDSSMGFGKRELFPHPLAKRIKVSNKMLRVSSYDVEGLVRQRLAYKFAVTEENAFLNGTGDEQPLGVFVASDNGISTSRDVSTGNTTTSIKFDGLIEAKYALKAQYWGKARWIFHRDAVKQIAKLKDGEGQYIWRESVRAGEPDRVLNIPLSISEYAPNTFSTGLYVGIIGDFSFYWIADALNMQIQRLTELYAETNQTGFIGRLECDGMPVLEEAFCRVTLA